MSTILNIIWLFFAGLWIGIGYLTAAVALTVTIIGIPFAIQLVKLAAFAFWPFGRAVVTAPGSSAAVSTVGNLLWLVVVGWWLALVHVISGLVLCITIIGIPFGVGVLKMTGLALWPFGRTVVEVTSAVSLPPGSYTVTSRVVESD